MVGMTLKSFDIVLVALLILLLAIRLIIAYHTSIDECPLGYEEWFVRPPLLVIPFQVKIGNSKLFGHFKRIPVVRRLLHLISGKRKKFGKKCEKFEKLYRIFSRKSFWASPVKSPSKAKRILQPG
jgi:hypothetical protein